MYTLRRWDEERIIQGLAVLMCIAMVGMMVMPMVVGDAWGLIGIYVLDDMPKGAQTGWLVSGLLTEAMYAGAIGLAFGNLPGAVAGFTIGL